MPRTSLALGVVLAVMLALPALSAGYTQPGENGRIVFTSGRDATDATARLYLLPVPGSTGGGTVSPPITNANTVQHRHATWSPDRTMIAYARGDSATANFDIFVQDLTVPGSTPVNITNSNNVTDDRPAWSPDGTKIAYQSEVLDGSNQTDILIRDAPGGGNVTNFTNTPNVDGKQFEGKPDWLSNGAALFYEKGTNPNSAVNGVNIVLKALSGGSETLAVADSGQNEFQPAISPDGTKICFTKSNLGFNGSADVLVAPLTNPASSGTIVSQDATAGDYNCTWSPDGTLIAYVNGVFSTGALTMVRADGTSTFPITLAQDANSNRFDGNPAWAPDARPVCPDADASTRAGVPVTITLECTDTGPQYEQTNVREFVTTSPAHGTVTQDLAGDPFLYTPKKGFKGTDFFLASSFDELGFGIDTGKVTIKVLPALKCGHKTVTIYGTGAADTISGTKKRDVIAALGGKDKVKGRRGNDIICGGSRNDVLGGGSGKDLIFGNSGNDTISGDSGKDNLNGGSGRDKLKGGSSRDRLNGNSGRDNLDGGSARDRCAGGSGHDKAKHCEVRSSIP